MLQAAIENEVAKCIERFKDLKDNEGRRAVVRNAKNSQRITIAGIRPLQVRQPCVRDRRLLQSPCSGLSGA